MDLMQKFIDLVLEGDELYPKVDRNTQASDSEGWTMIWMDRSSRKHQRSGWEKPRSKYQAPIAEHPETKNPRFTVDYS